jgi:hypothetical protein
MKTQTITKKNLKKIHDVACDTWKKKLEGYANRKPFDSEIELTEDEIDEMFGASDANQKQVLSKFFVKERKGIMGRVTSYKTACEVLGISSEEKRTPFERLCIIIKALNEGWWPNFNNSSEYKYWNYFIMRDGVFSFCDVVYDYTNLSVPSALYLKSHELAEYAVEIALEDYREVYI